MLVTVYLLPLSLSVFFFFNDTATTEIYTLSLHDALPIGQRRRRARSDWSSATVGERAMLLAADDADRVLRLLETLEPTALTYVMALNVTAGGPPGIAASLSVDRGDAQRGLSAIRALADRLVA